jgi:hypothetical protein
MKNRSARWPALLSSATLMAALVMVPTPAHAIPSSCSFGFYNTNAASYATCSVGSGQFRAKIQCDLPWEIDTFFYGNWLGVTVPPSNSIAQCPPRARKGYNVGIDRR